MNKIILMLLAFLLSILTACTPSIVVSPSELPNAKIGKPYFIKIEIVGGGGPVSSGGVNYTITPDNSGLVLAFSDPESPVKYNSLIIKGTPTEEGNITVRLRGDTYRTYSSVFSTESSMEFDKTYNIKVKGN